jgi:hypothetical protein
MRYKSLLSVDIVLVDGRPDAQVLTPIVNQCLMALSLHLQYHVVVLCRSKWQADEIDLLGEQCGKELYFHGELAGSIEESSALAKAAKLVILPGRSIERSHWANDNIEIITPILLVAPDQILYYPIGQRSTEIVVTTLMECLMSLPGPPSGAVVRNPAS